MPSKQTERNVPKENAKNKSSYTCLHFSESLELRQHNGTAVYGYCSKDLSKGHDSYPVYLPQGSCKQYHLKIPKEN